MNQEIYEVLAQRIVTLQYKPGQIINLKAVASEFHVSTTPVREALLCLTQQHLVTAKPYVGMCASNIDLKSIRDAYELKITLEGLASRLVARQGNVSVAERLNALLKTMEQIPPDHSAQFNDLDEQCHALIREACGNEQLCETLENLHMQTLRFRNFINFDAPDRENCLTTFHQIANAIINADEQSAEEAAKRHTSTFFNHLLQRFFAL